MKKGFTLIELMVVVSVIAILTSASISSYTLFSQKRAIVDESAMVVSEMNRVYVRAVSNYYPEGCDKIISYSVRVDDDKKGFVVTMNCTKAGLSNPTIEERKNVLSNSTMEIRGSSVIEFVPGSGALSDGEEKEIVLKDSDNTATIIVGNYGDIHVKK